MVYKLYKRKIRELSQVSYRGPGTLEDNAWGGKECHALSQWHNGVREVQYHGECGTSHNVYKYKNVVVMHKIADRSAARVVESGPLFLEVPAHGNARGNGLPNHLLGNGEIAVLVSGGTHRFAPVGILGHQTHRQCARLVVRSIRS